MRIFVIMLSTLLLCAGSPCEKRSEYWLEGFDMALFDLGTEVGMICGGYGVASEECFLAESIYHGVFDMRRLERGRAPDVGGQVCEDCPCVRGVEK